MRTPRGGVLARAHVERESVRVTGMRLQYIACNYTYKYDSKYGALWTCPEDTVYSAIFLSYLVVACTMASNS